MRPVAVSIGGSFLVGPEGVDVALVTELGQMLARVAQTRPVIVVVGGGAVARTYIQAARALGLDETSLDEVGIAVTRLNARVLASATPGAAATVATNFDDALALLRDHEVVVMGGTHPGHTTDAVAIMLADRAHASRVVIATNVDGVYTADPRKDPTATRLARLSAGRLAEIAAATGEARAGGSGVVDALGARMLARAHLEAAIVHGRDLKALEGALTGSTDFAGSLITPEDA